MSGELTHPQMMSEKKLAGVLKHMYSLRGTRIKGTELKLRRKADLNNTVLTRYKIVPN